MPAFEWVHVQLHQQKGMISLSPPTICNSAENRILGQYRGGPRYFRTIDAAASLLIQHGIYRFEADVAGWKPKTLTRKGGELLGGTGIEP
ncbi:transposase [Klebsiella pneumoniae]|nr:transposase [Klebsiella pneumoniae]